MNYHVLWQDNKDISEKMPQGVTRFLNLINAHVGELSRLIESNEIDKRLIDGGFATLDELLPSVKFVRQRIRFLLFQVSIQDSEADIIRKRGEGTARWRNDAAEMFMRDVESVTGQRLSVTLPPHIASNMANVAYKAAQEFVEWFYAREGKRERIRRCMSPLCAKFFKPTKNLHNFCSPECEETEQRLKLLNKG